MTVARCNNGKRECDNMELKDFMNMNKLCGDVDFDKVAPHTSAITPAI